MNKQIFINRNQFMAYRGCSINTARKLYMEYLDKAGKQDDQELTIFDLNKIDFVPLEDIMERCGII
jgi:hypothetical protein